MADQANTSDGEPITPTATEDSATDEGAPAPTAEENMEVEEDSSADELPSSAEATLVQHAPAAALEAVMNGAAESHLTGAPLMNEADLSVLEIGSLPQDEEDKIDNDNDETNVDEPSALVDTTETAETTAAPDADDSSVKTEESAEDSKSSSSSDDSDSDSVSTESSEDSSSSSGSSSSSEDPSVVGGIRAQDIIYEERGSEDDMEEIDPNGHNGNFTIDDEDEEDERDAILLKGDVHPDLAEKKSPLYDDTELGQIRSPSEKMMRQRAMVRTMVIHQLKGRRAWDRRENKRRIRTPRDIPLHWDDEAASIPRGTRGWTHRNKQRRFCYATLSVMIFIVGVSLMIYGVARQREYTRSQAAMDDEYNDDYYYYDDEYDDFFTQKGSGSLQSPSNNAHPPTHAPSAASDDELLELLKLAYKSAFHSIPPTTETLHIIDMVETDLLNASIQTKTEASKQSVQWRAYQTLLQREDVFDKTKNEPIMEEEVLLELYGLTCFVYNFNFAQELDDSCQWKGIKCDDVFLDTNNDVMYPSFDGLRVVSITLPNESLTGTLPVELIFLSHLETLDLPNNFISGSLPKFFPEGQIESLKVLSLHDNRFEGSIPVEMSKLKDLQKVSELSSYF
jgi:hypothetical protein